MLKVSFLCKVLVTALCFCSNLHARPASLESSENVSIVGILGSAVAVSAVIVAGDWIVTNVKQAHDKVKVTLHSQVQRAHTTITLPAKQLEKTPLIKGQKIQVEPVQTGYLFTTQGNTLGFLPNQKGKPLIHSSSYN
jgi:hypothetical protein